MSAELRALLQQGHSARSKGRPDDALRAFEDAITLAKKSGAKEELVHALKGHGQIERDLGRTAAAKARYQQATDECRTFADALLLAHTIRHLADIHSDQNEFALAEPLYREVLTLYRSNLGTSVLDLANAVRPFAILLESTGRHAEAKDACPDPSRPATKAVPQIYDDGSPLGKTSPGLTATDRA